MSNVKITILQTSDVHGNIFSHQYSTNEGKELGLGKIASIIEQERISNDHTILIDNGDLIQGTPLTYHYVKKQSHQKNPMILLLNELNYDVAVVGNHEFNYGRTILEQAVAESSFPWLSANIIDDKKKAPFLGKPYIIKVIDGIKVAILGVTTHYIPNWEDPAHIVGLHFEDALLSTKKWIEKIRNEEQPDVMIVSYHGGFERDMQIGEPTEELTTENQGYQICHEVEGIDVLLTGHQHRTISGELNGVTVVQPSFNGQAIARIELKVDKNSKRIIKKEATILKAENVQPNKKLLSIVESYEKETQGWLDQPIGKVIGDMTVKDGFQLRIIEHPLIEFINKVQMEASGVSLSNTALFNNESPGLPMEITMRDIVSNYIYPNTLKVIKITGSDIKSALERSASYFELDKEGNPIVNPEFSVPKPQHYNYDMWEGIDYTLDISRPIGERVVKLVRSGQPLHLSDEFEVVMNNYRAGGGGEYIMFKGKPVVKEIPIDMSELMADYIMERKIIHADVNHNWSVVW
ncbi:bifunctional metallophosphatase/5'-nucleotidase [Metabacillus herbersteinensis]|uniref:Bifunctional metallophosphatase/5'-nucleotidase n=1 Tax=Metabacillus herbersteinensis TaxID=283816 RepID=A0ABV6GA31_9BACI